MRPLSHHPDLQPPNDQSGPPRHPVPTGPQIDLGGPTGNLRESLFLLVLFLVCKLDRVASNVHIPTAFENALTIWNLERAIQRNTRNHESVAPTT